MKIAILLTVMAVGCQGMHPEQLVSGRKIGGYDNWNKLGYAGYDALPSPAQTEDERVEETKEEQNVSVTEIEESPKTEVAKIESNSPKSPFRRVKIGSKPHREMLKKRRKTINVLFDHLFEIIQDVFHIVTEINRHAYIERKDNSIGANSKFDAWPLLKNVFLKYIKMLKETELMDSLGHIIPVYELEEALEVGDAEHLLRVITESVTPRMFAFLFDTMRDFIMYLTYVGEKAEIREYVPSGVDILYPIRVIIEKTFGLIQTFISRNQISQAWDEFRSYSPGVARSLEYMFPLDDDVAENGVAVLANTIASDRAGKEVGFLSSAMSYPYTTAVGVGSAVAASVYLYRSFSDSEDNVLQQQRSFGDEEVIQKIVAAVEKEPSFVPKN